MTKSIFVVGMMPFLFGKSTDAIGKIMGGIKM